MFRICAYLHQPSSYPIRAPFDDQKSTNFELIIIKRFYKAQSSTRIITYIYIRRRKGGTEYETSATRQVERDEERVSQELNLDRG